MIKRILVGIGGSDFSVSAFQQAIELAKFHHAQLTGVSVCDERRLKDVGPPNVRSSSFVQDVADNRVQKALLEQSLGIHEFEKACDQAEIPYNVIRESGEPFTVFREQARYHDLMVFGLKGLFEFDVIKDPEDYLIQLVQSGVRPILATSEQYRPVKKVLICYSGSMESAKTMKHFVQSTLWSDATLRVACFGKAHEDPQTLVDQAVAYCQSHDFDTDGVVIEGSAQDHIIPYAQGWDADLIVLGNSARQLLLRRIFGETAMHVIRNSHIPLYLAQ